MKKWIRYTSIVLTIMLCIGSVAVAEEETESAMTMQEDGSVAFSLLHELGMLDDTVATMTVKENICRDQFAGILAQLLGGGTSVADKDSFLDLSEDNPYCGAIYFLKDLDILHGVGRRLFEPKKHITLEQAVSLTVNALGYGQLAQLKYGTGYIGYSRMAQQLELFDGISADNDDVITVQQAVTLLYNASIAPVLETTVFGESNHYTANENRTILSVYCGILHVEGIITDNGITALNGSSIIDENQLKVGNIVLNTEEKSSTKDLIGYNVNCYYREQDDLLLYTYANIDNKVLELTYDILVPDDSRFGVNELVYAKDDKFATANISAKADLLYNGIAYPEFTKDTLCIDSGRIELLDNNYDGAYDVIIIWEYESAVVTSVNGTEQTIAGNNGTCLKLGDYEFVSIFGSNGTEGDISLLAANQVISWMTSLDDRMISIYASSSTVGGQITSVATQDEQPICVINDQPYQVANSLLKDIKKGTIGAEIPKAGRTYVLRLDFMGEIAGVDSRYGQELQYAYLIGFDENSSGFETEPRFRLVMQDGTIYDAYAARSITLNGQTGIKSEQLLSNSALLDEEGNIVQYGLRDGQGKVIRQVVKVRFNSVGDICELQLATTKTNAYGYNTNDFSRDYFITSQQYKGGNVRILGRYAIDADAIVFADPDKTNPDASASGADIEVLRGTELTDKVSYKNVDLYDADTSLTVQALSYDGSRMSTIEQASILIVDSVVQSIDENGDSYRLIYGMVAGLNVSYPEKEPGIIPDGLKQGDICYVQITNNELVNVEHMISLADHPAPQIQERDGKLIGGRWVNMFGYLYAKGTNVLTILNEEDSPHGKLSTVSLQGKVSPIVTVYDAKLDKIYKGSIADLTPVGTPNRDGNIIVDDNAPMVFIWRRYEYMKEAVVVYY